MKQPTGEEWGAISRKCAELLVYCEKTGAMVPLLRPFFDDLKWAVDRCCDLEQQTKAAERGAA